MIPLRASGAEHGSVGIGASSTLDRQNSGLVRCPNEFKRRSRTRASARAARSSVGSIDGRITIDGRVAQLGDQLRGRERVCVDGRPIKLSAGQTRAAHQHLAYYKNAEPRESRWAEGLGAGARGAAPAARTLDRRRRARPEHLGLADPHDRRRARVPPQAARDGHRARIRGPRARRADPPSSSAISRPASSSTTASRASHRSSARAARRTTAGTTSCSARAGIASCARPSARSASP